MSEQYDFEAKLKAFAKELLQEIDERNEGLLEGMRDIAHLGFTQPFLESDEPPSPVAHVPESVNIAPRIGFSNKAIELFQHVEDYKRRQELMAQFSHMEHARSRKEWVVWAAHVQLLLEGFSAEYLFRADSWVKASGEGSLLSGLLSMIDGRQIQRRLVNGKWDDGKLDDEKNSVPAIRSANEFERQLDDGFIGVDEQTGVAMALDDYKFFYARDVRWSAGRLVIQAEKKGCEKRVFNFDVKNCPSAIPHLKILGLFVPSRILETQQSESFETAGFRFMLGPLPFGLPGKLDKFDRNQRNIRIGPNASIAFSERYARNGFGAYWSQSNVYEIAINPTPNWFFVNIYIRGGAQKWALSDLNIKERFVLMDMIASASTSGSQVDSAWFDFNKWWDSLLSENYCAWDELSGMRNRFFHGGETALAYPNNPSEGVLKISEMVEHVAKKLFHAP